MFKDLKSTEFEAKVSIVFQKVGTFAYIMEECVDKT
jgi:hypothetical protein